MSNVLKKSIDPDDATAGFIEYKSEAPLTDSSGLFVTTYYFRETDCAECNDFKGQDSPWVKNDVYKVGLLQYLAVTDRPEFAGWKLVILTDQHSMDNPFFRTNTETERAQKHKREWEKIAAHPNTVFAVVTWPEYAVGSKGDGKTVDNAILRALRMKAFTDFPDIPVFVRDADTLFENLIKDGGGSTTLPNFTEKFALWEKTLWDKLAVLFADPNPYRILIASQPNYHRQWHIHPETGTNTPGCYAAITSSLGGIPEMTDGSYWKAALKYLRQTSRVIQKGSDRSPENLSKPTYIGKDEQLLSYVMIPMMFEKVYFYYFEYIQVEGGPVKDTPETPFAKILLENGIAQYPSPYKLSLGESLLPASSNKRKDANEVTETTLINPDIIPMSLDPAYNQIMKTIFKYYGDLIAETKTAPGFVSQQLGGGRRRRSTKKKRARKARRRSHRHR